MGRVARGIGRPRGVARARVRARGAASDLVRCSTGKKTTHTRDMPRYLPSRTMLGPGLS